jgi:hypothetical protein
MPSLFMVDAPPELPSKVQPVMAATTSMLAVTVIAVFARFIIDSPDKK